MKDPKKNRIVGFLRDEKARTKVLSGLASAMMIVMLMSAVIVGMLPVESEAATPASVTYVDGNVTVDSIDDNFDWDALWNRGSFSYRYGDFVVKGARNMNVPGYVAWYNVTTGEGGVVDAVATSESYSGDNHGSTSVKIDSDGTLWMATGGYGSNNALKLFKSDAPLDVNNWTEFASISTGVGTCEPRIVLNDTLVTVFWRDGVNDASSTNIRQKTWYKGTGTLKRDRDIAVGGASHTSNAVTNSYVDTHYDVYSDAWYLSWSYKETDAGLDDLWGDFPFIKVTDAADTGDLSCFFAPDGTSYEALDDGDGLLEYDELDIPYQLFPDDIDLSVPAASIPRGHLPDGTLYWIQPYDKDNSTEGIDNAGAVFLTHDGTGWSSPTYLGDWDYIGHLFRFVVTDNYAGLIHANSTDIYLRVYDYSSGTWDSDVLLISESENISGLDVSFPVRASDIDDQAVFLYATTNMDLAGGEDPKHGQNNYRAASFDMSVFASGGGETNSAPEITWNSPVDGSTDVDVNVSFSVTVSDPDGDTMTVKWWNWTGATWEAWGQNSSVANGTYMYSPGTLAYNYTYTVRASVEDGEYTVNSETITFTTVDDGETPNEPPTADFSWTADGLTISFADDSTDVDGSITGWSWEFGDGSGSSLQNPTHTYTADGTYQVNLTVTDDDGATDTASASLVVSSGSGDTTWGSDANLLLYGGGAVFALLAFAIAALYLSSRKRRR